MTEIRVVARRPSSPKSTAGSRERRASRIQQQVRRHLQRAGASDISTAKCLFLALRLNGPALPSGRSLSHVVA